MISRKQKKKKKRSNQFKPFLSAVILETLLRVLNLFYLRVS